MAATPPSDPGTFEAALAASTRRPIVAPAIVAANLVVFVLMGLAGAGWVSVDSTVHIRWGSNFGPFTSSGDWWRLVTSLFVHFGVLHVALNMWALYDAGRLAERIYGPVAFTAIYLFSGVTGGLASLYWNPMVNSAGASGAIFGVFGALLAYMLDRSHGVPLSVMRAHRASLIAFIGYALAFGFIAPGIDNAAHLGGLVGGTVLGFLVARPLGEPVAGRFDPRWLWAVVGAPLLLVALASQVPNSGPAYQADQQFREVLDRFAPAAREMLEELERTGQAYQRRERPASDAVARLESQARRWDELSADLGGPRLDRRSAYARLQLQLLRYTALQRDSARLMAEAIREGNQEKAARARQLRNDSRAVEKELERTFSTLYGDTQHK